MKKVLAALAFSAQLTGSFAVRVAALCEEKIVQNPVSEKAREKFEKGFLYRGPNSTVCPCLFRANGISVFTKLPHFGNAFGRVRIIGENSFSHEAALNLLFPNRTLFENSSYTDYEKQIQLCGVTSKSSGAPVLGRAVDLLVTHDNTLVLHKNRIVPDCLVGAIIYVAKFYTTEDEFFKIITKFCKDYNNRSAKPCLIIYAEFLDDFIVPYNPKKLNELNYQKVTPAMIKRVARRIYQTCKNNGCPVPVVYCKHLGQDCYYPPENKK